MYLTEIYLENTGPITKCHVKPPFDNGNPLPIVIVGPNGSGKTIFLSYIVDALTEFAKTAFVDVVPTDGLSAPYFRVIHQRAIRSGASFSLSLLHFKANEDDLYYCEKSGILDPTTYSPSMKSVFSKVWRWPEDKNHKDVLADEKLVKTEMQGGAYAFFPASRREDPDWLNPKSLKVGINASANRRSKDVLDKPLWVGTCATENISWVLDVFLDSLIEPNLLFRVHTVDGRRVISGRDSASEAENFRNRSLLSQTRQNVENILKAIFQDQDTKLILNYRNFGSSRISVKMSDGRIIPTLQSLSEGQSQLFHLFATIMRYGEQTDLNRSVNLSEIIGLVVIDEIAAHLHPTLQYDVLPQLIKMFPKVQFIVSSHSPLFLLGMENRFGADRVTILELPEAKPINSERYSEFGTAFEYYKTTERFEEDIKQLIASATKPVVLTEGKTDARYIQTALELLGEEELLNSLDIRSVGKEGDEGDEGGGQTGLNNFYKVYAAHPLSFNHAILLLYDWDANKLADQIEKLWIRSIRKNSEDAEEKKGIENLFPSHLFKDCFYEEKPKKGIHGKSNVIHDFKKQEFCDWICDVQKDPANFVKFDSVVEILKEFFEATQSPPVQQPPE